ncbi:MAG TPA: hypothetical protein DEF47_02060 [Herpetosiphon sp.]|uniref:Beta-lactamase domain protein n=1 Tax=Herpetosiphon aurantiacus (strain ATCC 23779 / DSM 785 / 114-95) TaxID=316274 RepID=A9AVC6_HERA2|nr:hypothetical protein [Herpetosiphon sp.]ABX04617.1 hypothetical protein Haur_1974 [Herpetosiphon aurantiacus DSM 785]HBW48671.1 hypothetical protein [Herpetosiphon sp.]
MPWELQIHHLDIRSVGDATVILALDNNVVQRSVLIDGGRADAAPIVHNYLANTLNLNTLDVIVNTHYDDDHLSGLISLMATANTNVYDNVRCFDQGRPPNNSDYYANAPYRANGANTSFKRGKDQYGNEYIIRAAPKKYEQYVTEIARVNTRVRVTSTVNSFYLTTYDQNDIPTNPGNRNGYTDTILMQWNYYAAYPTINYPAGGLPNVVNFDNPAWLIGQEIMWNGAVYVPGAPTITCIAANKYVSRAGVNAAPAFISTASIYNGPNRRMSDADINDQENKNDNAKSLAFIIEFNNHRYYVGGDIERPQEDGFTNPNTGNFQLGIRDYLVPQSRIDQRVLSMKTSHHGSATASSRTFISQLMPMATFISTGSGNHHDHPAQSTVNTLDGYPEQPILGDPNQRLRHPPAPPQSPQQPNPYYLTGYQNVLVNPPLSYGGIASRTAGDPANNIAGHIKLTVTEAQSQLAIVGQVYRGVVAVVNQINQSQNQNVDPVPIATAATKIGTAAAVAAVLGVNDQGLQAIINSCAWVGNDINNLSVVGAAITAMNTFVPTNPNDPNDTAAEAAKNAAQNVDNGARVGHVGVGASTAIGYAVTGANANVISVATSNAGATQTAATAAGNAATYIYNHIANSINGPDVAYADRQAGFAAAAALGGVANGNLTAANATILACAHALAMPIGADPNNAALYAGADQIAQWITAVALAMNLNNNLACLAGAVASASYYLGNPADVDLAVSEALKAIAVANNTADQAGNAALQAATLVQNDLCNVQFDEIDPNPLNLAGFVAENIAVTY